MRTFSARFIVSCALLFTQPVSGQSALYTVDSKAQGTPFDLVVTETKREPINRFSPFPGFKSAPLQALVGLLALALISQSNVGSHIGWLFIHPRTVKF